jgi:hypothetical protein
MIQSLFLIRVDSREFAAEKPSGAKALLFLAEYRRHKCLLHPVMARFTPIMLGS